MKRILLILITAVSLSAQQLVSAMPPPVLPIREITVVETVVWSSHIFVGVAQKLVVMDRNGEVKPEPMQLDVGQYFMLEVKVNEVLKPVLWNPENIIKVPYRGRMFQTGNVRRQFVGVELIFLTQINLSGKNSPYFELPDKSFLAENNAEVRALVKPDPSEGQQSLRMEWLAKCLKDAESVHVGMTRQELEKMFDDNIGQSAAFNPNRSRYVHRNCTLLSIDVEFTPTLNDGRSNNNHNLDKISKVSKSYLEWLPSSPH